MQVFTYNSSKANVGAMRPDKQTAAIKITSDLRNIVKERVVRKKNSVYEESRVMKKKVGWKSG